MGNLPSLKQTRILYLKKGIEGASKFALVVDEECNNIEYLHSTEGFSEKLKTWSPELIILEWDESVDKLTECITLARNILAYAPLMLVVSDSKTNLGIMGLNAGADDMVTTANSTDEFHSRLNVQLRNKRTHNELFQANTRLQELVEIDDLTGLFNMRSIFNKLSYELARGTRYKRSVAVLMLDIDNFKNVNDHHDHLFGSYVLAEIGAIIKKTMRKIDIAARYGGDEFVVILTEIDEQGANIFAERLRKNIENYTFNSDNHDMKITVSIGVAVTPASSEGVEAKDLVRCADRALYSAKSKGRNCVESVSFGSISELNSSEEDAKTATIAASELGSDKKQVS